MGRPEVEREIAADEAVLTQVAQLIEARAPLASWPDDVRAALLVALDDTQVSRAERWQIIALRRHLYGGDAASETPPPLEHGSPVVRRRAERLRDGLSAMVAFRAGRYLRG